MCKQPLRDLTTQVGNPKPGHHSDERSLSSGSRGLSAAPPPPTASDSHVLPVKQSWSKASGTNSQPPSTSVKESDILSDEDDDGFCETGGRRRDSRGSSSTTSALEAQFLQLELSEEASSECALAPRVQPEGVDVTPESHKKVIPDQFDPVSRKTSSSFRRSQGALVNMKEHSRSLDSQADINALLEREFSVQSLTSVVNEDCFYDPAETRATDSDNTPPS